MQASDIEDTIITEMTATLLCNAYCYYTEEHGIKLGPGSVSIETIPIPTPGLNADAIAVAQEIYDGIEADWFNKLRLAQAPFGTINLAEIVYNHCEWELGSDEPEVVLPLVESWAYDAAMTAIGEGVRWEDNHPEVTCRGVKLTVEHVHREAPFWDDDPGGRRRINQKQACEIASHWHGSMYDPIYAFSSTGKVQSDDHRTNTISGLRKCLIILAEQYPLASDDIQDLADLIAYVAVVPVREV